MEHAEEEAGREFWQLEDGEFICPKCKERAFTAESVAGVCCNCAPPESDLFKLMKEVSNQMAEQYRQRREPMEDV